MLLLLFFLGGGGGRKVGAWLVVLVCLVLMGLLFLGG